MGPSIPAPQPLKKKKSSTHRRVGTTHECTQVQLLSGAKGPMLECSAPLWLAKALKSRRGGALQKPILCCYFPSSLPT